MQCTSLPPIYLPLLFFLFQPLIPLLQKQAHPHLCPLSSVLSPTDSDGIPHSTTANMQARPDAAENPVLHRTPSPAAPLAQARSSSAANALVSTPGQLLKLKECVAADNRPTSACCRDIARELGMDERQTQILFQNRFVSLCVLHLYALSPLTSLHLADAPRPSCNSSSRPAQSKS